ncbi:MICRORCHIDIA 7 protein [Nymphaea thermarum]|nr:MICRORCHIDIA 7 protein [Nymphaea thermarum]
MSVVVKQECTDSDVWQPDFRRPHDESRGLAVMNLNGLTDSEDDVRSKLPDGSASRKWMKPEALDVIFPAQFVKPVLLGSAVSTTPATGSSGPVTEAVPLSWVPVKRPAPCRQFWKAGDYEGDATVQNGSSLGKAADSHSHSSLNSLSYSVLFGPYLSQANMRPRRDRGVYRILVKATPGLSKPYSYICEHPSLPYSINISALIQFYVEEVFFLSRSTCLTLDMIFFLGGIDHARIHPKFLHANATSHKWALGAFAELLDNALDEVCNGATYVNVDMLINKKDGSKMLLVEDDGGGMSPDKMRQCMSLGYSAKSKLANTIGQYGNGFKTSTMRLGADVIVFSRHRGKDGKSPTQSIGLLSYTFLRSTGKEDIVVPMVDYEKVCQGWKKLSRSSQSDWTKNVETIVQWSPYSSEADLLQEISLLQDQGTRIVIYNLWEDDLGELELDSDTDQYDIQLRGVNRDKKKINMSQKFPNSRHFLTYRHSLRSYASIIYLRLPEDFRMILRGKDVEHHNIVNDMMLTQEITYRPLAGGDRVRKDASMVAMVTIGFVKDAKDHIDVQGFNVYHKNRLIKPFWRVWNAAGSDGRGVIGVLEANFVEPAHDKQDFERTTILSRLEARLVQIQKNYWSSNCHKIGYAPRNRGKSIELFSPEIEENEESTGDVENRRPHLTSASSGTVPERSLLKSLNRKGHKRQQLEESERSTSMQKRMHKDQQHTPPANGHSATEVQEYVQKLQEAHEEQEYIISIFSEEKQHHGKEVEGLKKTLKVMV